MANERLSNEARTERILQEVQRLGIVSVEHLVGQLNVSVATVRRDLTELERRGLLRRTHGGATSVEPLLYEPFRHDSSFQEQEAQFAEEKRRIGMAAAELIRDGDVIALTPGTTSTQIARSIRHRKAITIVTNAVNIAMELSNRSELSVFLTGGFVRGSWFSTIGASGIQALGELFVDTIFIGVNGIHPTHGLTAFHTEEAATIRAMIRQSRQRVVIADHSKLGVIATSLICPMGEVQLLITDNAATDAQIDPILAAGVEVRRI